MTATLVRPASPARLRPGTGTPVRVRPVPVTDPPAGSGAWRPAPDRATGRERAPAPAAGGPVHRTTVDAHLAARRYLDLVLEVLGGYRPVGHLRVHTDAAQFDEIVAELTHLGGPALSWPGSGLMQGSG